MDSYAKLLDLLSKETFPHTFTYKVVGKNTPAFLEGIAKVEAEFADLKFAARRDSAQGNHVSVTFTQDAKSAEAIVTVYRRLQALPDVLFML